ncbi:MAG: TetR/AcrR family transcriptional regulator [Minicystis sp.]
MTDPRAPLHAPRMVRATQRPKRSYHHGDLRRALLDAAIGILTKEGVHALTLREVARRVGVSQAAPYHHFADKEAILAAVAEEGFVELNQAMVEARDAAGAKPTARLRAMGCGYVRFAVAHPAHFRVMFVQMCDVPKHPSLQVAADRAFETLLESITAGQKAGIVRRGDPIELSVLAWSTVHGLSMLWIEGAIHDPTDFPRSIDDLAEAAADMLVRGLGK